MDVKEQHSVLAQVLYVKEKMSPGFFCAPRSLSCLEVPLVRCEDHAAPCQAHYLYVECESCLQAESVPSTLSHIKGAILGLAVNTFIALLNTSRLFI